MADPMVFIVDDDESVRRALTRLMKSAGLEARAFSSAADFLSQGCQDAQSCLILDMRMPGMDGLELQEKLRESACRIPIVFITAHEDAVAREQAMRGGALAFLQKPFEDQVLIDAVNLALRGSGE